jgi:hypothetical protein
MPLTEEQQRTTPASVIRDVVGAGLEKMYVTVRHPLAGTWLDGPALVVIVDEHRADGRSYVSEVTAEIPKRTGSYHEVFVYSADEQDDLTLRDEDLVEV